MTSKALALTGSETRSATFNRRALLALGAASALVSAQEHAAASGIPAAAEGAALEADMNMMVKPESLKSELPINKLDRLAGEIAHTLDEWNPERPWSVTVWPASSGRGVLMTDQSPDLQPDARMIDGKLFDLEAEFNAAWERWEEAIDRLSEAETKLLAQRPPQPADDRPPQELWERYANLTLKEVRDETHPMAQEWAAFFRQKQERLDSWAAECERLSRKLGVRRASKASDRLCVQTNRIAWKIMKTPAKTRSGLKIKLRVQDMLQLDSEAVLEHIAADIDRFAWIA